ncbi:hypothetical protein SHK09_15245 [Polaribacter sp. PL03]|uniref:hypothetical protein n=1 Tax=Polaribacter sp. PL03 TaxID=3088353 RepID=UPI0029CD5B36|nr:hypothetical protein [Polaribacter sp. PL03]MDX6748152.1 hypothetical protein [Polaribacter sp. PL03]
METLKLHSLGQNDHLKSLKKKYDLLKNRITGNEKMSENDKKTELKNLAKSFDREKKDSNRNLY